MNGMFCNINTRLGMIKMFERLFVHLSLTLTLMIIVTIGFIIFLFLWINKNE